MTQAHGLIIPLEYRVLQSLASREWPIDRPFRRSELVRLLVEDHGEAAPDKASVGLAIGRLRDVGFLHRTCRVSGKQTYVQADQWSDARSADFLQEHIRRPEDTLLAVDTDDLYRMRERVLDEGDDDVLSDAIHLAVRTMRLNRVYITLSKYAWVPVARDLFELEFETRIERRDRIAELIRVIAQRDLDAMERMIPSTILQP